MSLDDLDSLLTELETPSDSAPPAPVIPAAPPEAKPGPTSYPKIQPSGRLSKDLPPPAINSDIVNSMENDVDASDPEEFEATVGRQAVSRQLRSYNRTQIERDIFTELNRFRENPSAYAATLEKKRLPFYKGNELLIKDEQGRDVSVKTKEGERGCEGAISYCRRASPLRRLEFSEAMSLACKEAVADLGSNGRVLTNALPKLQNLGRFAPGSQTLVKEVACFGEPKAEDVVMHFLISDGDNGRMMRDSVSDSAVTHCGIAYGPHNSDYKTMCVVVLCPNWKDY